MQIGLVGLPAAGKTTFFNLLTGANHKTGFEGSGEVHVGAAEIPDRRLDYLADLYYPRKKVNAILQIKDIPGVARGEGSGSRAARMLEEVREADALVQVIRAFVDEQVSALAGELDPYRDLVDFRTEILLADLAAVERQIERLQNARKLKGEERVRLEVLERFREALENEQPLTAVALEPHERALMAGQTFLSEKPLLAAVNLDENYLSAGSYPGRDRLLEYTARLGIPVMELSARIEMEIGSLPEEERAAFLADLSLSEPGIARLARAAYQLLGLVSFFTIGENEVRAWTVQNGTAARKAAGKVHSDMERGFIKAEVMHFDDLYKCGSAAKVKEMGLLRLEGKEYLVRDGDIIKFRFNV